MKGAVKDLIYYKSPLQQSFDNSNPEYNKFYPGNFNSALLIKRKDDSEKRKSTSFRLLKSKDKTFSMTFLNISNRTLSKKIQRNTDDSNLFSDDRFKRSQILIPRRKVDTGKISDLLTQRCLKPSVIKQQTSVIHDLQLLAPIKSKSRKQTTIKLDSVQSRQLNLSPSIHPLSRERINYSEIRKTNYSKKCFSQERKQQIIKTNDLNRWQKEDAFLEPTTIEQYIAQKVHEPIKKLKRKYNRNILR